MLNLDTHILLYTIPGRLTRQERRALEDDSEWSISAIVMWEIEMLHARRRIPHGLDHPVMAALLARIHIWPIGVEVCLHLRRLDFQADPADEIIAATSLSRQIPLITRDGRMRASKVLHCL